MKALTSACAFTLLLTAVSAQSQGPFDGEPPGRPVSAQQHQLTGDDPTGRGAVLVGIATPFLESAKATVLCILSLLSARL